MIKAILIGAGSRGMDAYGPYAISHPDELTFVAVAEPNRERLAKFSKIHNIDSDMQFSDYKEVLSADIDADVVLVCTQDKLHYEPTIMALDAGYHVLLEKPIHSLEDSLNIQKKVDETGKSLTICHVLRYTPFFSTIKELIVDGKIGELISITHNENVGHIHASHSYVRGNWRNEAQSSPMLLAKSCHDIDILMWLVGDLCKQVSSFGSLKHFVQKNAPSDASKRCFDCSVKDLCIYNAEKIYMDMDNDGWPVSTITEDMSFEGRETALKTGPYGRCVYHCDNDVVDHQAVIMEFDNGVTASFHMNSLTYDTSREIKICGSKGELVGKMETSLIEYYDYYTDTKEIIDTSFENISAYGHGGGDYGLMKQLVSHLNGNSERMNSDITSAVQSHIVTYAAETARKQGKVVSIDEFVNVD